MPCSGALQSKYSAVALPETTPHSSLSAVLVFSLVISVTETIHMLCVAVPFVSSLGEHRHLVAIVEQHVGLMVLQDSESVADVNVIIYQSHTTHRQHMTMK